MKNNKESKRKALEILTKIKNRKNKAISGNKLFKKSSVTYKVDYEIVWTRSHTDLPIWFT